jgi:hypothetical protein
MNPAQRYKSFAPKPNRRSTLTTSSIRRLLTLQCAAVTFCPAVQLNAQPCTRKTTESSQTNRPLKRRFYAVFTASHALSKKNGQVNTVCARLLHPTRHRLQRTISSGTLQAHNNSGRVAPRCFLECVHGGFFPSLFPIEKLCFSCQSGSRLTADLRHPSSKLRQGRKEAERIDRQVSPTLSA